MPDPRRRAAASGQEHKPDAVMMPAGWRDPNRPLGGGVLDHSCSAIEDILGGGRASRPAYVRHARGGVHFVSLDPTATENYPTGHEKEKTPRYDWEPQDNGLTYGYLKPEGPADRSAAQAALEEYQARVARWKELSDRPNSELSPEERIEFNDLNDGLFPGRVEARAEHDQAMEEQATAFRPEGPAREATHPHAQDA